MYIFSIYLHILSINVGLFRNVAYKYTLLCCFSHEGVHWTAAVKIRGIKVHFMMCHHLFFPVYPVTHSVKKTGRHPQLLVWIHKVPADKEGHKTSLALNAQKCSGSRVWTRRLGVFTLRSSPLYSGQWLSLEHAWEISRNDAGPTSPHLGHPICWHGFSSHLGLHPGCQVQTRAMVESIFLC